MKVRFNVNLGSRDASALGLDHKECTIGAVQDVSEDVLAILKRVGEGVVSEVRTKDEPKTEAPPKK
jgi:hypothetical protein